MKFPRSRRCTAPLLFAAASVFVPLSSGLNAQLPGVPVLQNAWASPGLAVAVNGGSGGGSRAAALAASWAPRSARFQVSGGLGIRDAEVGGRGGTFGARAAMPVWSFAGGAFGVAGFVGLGAAQEPSARFVATGDAGGTLTHVPIGAAIGYRRGFSFIRGISVYGAPFYSYHRLVVGDSSVSKGAVRFSAGVDVGVTDRIGVTGGAEFGGQAGVGEPGPTGAVYGLGVSLALGRGR